DLYNNAYTAYWSVKWADLIRSSTANVGEQGMWTMHNWLHDSFRTNKPYDQFVRELIMAKGSTFMDGPANFYRIAKSPPDAAETITDEPSDRRQPLADWLTSPTNHYFARNLVNRYMGYLMGRGIVEPIDDLRATNPASNEALLAALSEHFAKSGYDLKQLIRT